MTAQPQLTISPETSYLLNALRCIEDAKNNYYESLSAMHDESETDQLMALQAPKFDAARDLIESDLIANLRTWANRTDRPTEI